MKEDAHKRILDREEPQQFVEAHFRESLELLQEVTNYGSNLIPRCYVSSGKSLPDVVILGGLLKQAVAMLDAVEILVSKGAIFAANVPARSLLEVYIYINWILDSDTDKRARQYYVRHLRQERQWDRRLISGTDENSKFTKVLQNLSLMGDPSYASKLEQKAKKQELAINSILANGDYKDINAEFDRIKKRDHDQHWYSPWGPSSIRDMANRLQLDSEYTVLYSQFSDVTHSTAFKKHIGFDGEAAIFEPVRHLKGIKTLLSVVISLAIKIYRSILTKYRPGELSNFNRKYQEEWRERFRTIKTVKYKTEFTDPI